MSSILLQPGHVIQLKVNELLGHMDMNGSAIKSQIKHSLHKLNNPPNLQAFIFLSTKSVYDLFISNIDVGINYNDV